MARTVKVGEFQALQRESATAENGTANRPPGFRTPALSVVEQLQALVLDDDIAGMPVGQVTGLVKLAAQAAHVNATEVELRAEGERRWLDGKLEESPSGPESATFAEQTSDEEAGYDGPPVELKAEDRSCAHGVLGLHGICTTCGDYVGQADDLGKRLADRAESAVQAMMATDGGPNPDYNVADDLRAQHIEAQCTAEMSLSIIVDRVRTTAFLATIDATDAEIVAEAERIWEGFSVNRRGPLEVDVNADGTVAEVRPAEMTPDRGPDVGETHHTITDDEPRWSGGGATVGVVELIPGPSKFGQAPYIDAPELKAIAERLIDEKEALADLDDLQIVYRWKAKGGTAKGWPKLGGIERVSGQTLAFIAGKAPDLLVWLAADTLRESAVSEVQLEAMLFDQMVSVEWSDGDEDGDPTWRLVGPEIMCHLATLEEYGAFTRKLESAKSAFIQPSLFDATAASGERFTEDEARRVISIAAAAHAQQQAEGAGVLVHADGSPMTAEEVAEMEVAEERGEADDEDLDDGDDDDVEAFDPEEDGEELEEQRPRDPFMGRADADLTDLPI